MPVQGIVIEIDRRIPEEILGELRRQMLVLTDEVHVSRITRGPQASLEWTLPAAIMLLIGNGLLLAFLREIGSDTRSLKQDIANLFDGAKATPITWVSANPGGSPRRAPVINITLALDDADRGRRARFIFLDALDHAALLTALGAIPKELESLLPAPTTSGESIDAMYHEGHVRQYVYLPDVGEWLELSEALRRSRGTLIKQPSTGTKPGAIVSVMSPDPKMVFVIHGRNIIARTAIEHFLRALGLQLVDFDQLSADLGGTAFIGDIVRAGLEKAQGIIALFTPEEYATLRPEHRCQRDRAEEIQRWQARPNVIFEAGMAYGMAPDRTVLVTLGTDVALFSDVGGIHVVRLDNAVPSRARLRQKLIGVHCDVDQRSDSWTDPSRSGDFETCIRQLREVSPRDPF